MVLVDGQGVPLGVHFSFASPGEASLAEATLAQRVTRKLPVRLIAGKGYDARALWKRLKTRGIDLIAPHLRTRKNRYQDGRKLRRYGFPAARLRPHRPEAALKHLLAS